MTSGHAECVVISGGVPYVGSDSAGVLVRQGIFILSSGIPVAGSDGFGVWGQGVWCDPARVAEVCVPTRLLCGAM